MLALLTSGLGAKLIGAVALCLAIFTAGAWALHEHDAHVIAAAQAANRAHEIAALEAQSSDHQKQLAQLNSLKRKTHSAPTGNGCASSPAVRALLDGVRHPAAP